jgi:hypothetical protein
MTRCTRCHRQLTFDATEGAWYDSEGYFDCDGLSSHAAR